MAGEPTRTVSPYDIRHAYNGTGSDIAANTVVMLDATNEGGISLPSAVTDELLGVTMDQAIPDGEWGDVQIRGIAKCRANAALATLHVALMTVAATGRVEALTAAAGTNVAPVGQLLTTAGAQDDIVMVELAGPGQIQQIAD